MTPETICLTAGIIFVFIAVIGGGIKLKDTEIRPLQPKVCVTLAILGLLLILPFLASLIRDTVKGFPRGTIVAWWSKSGNAPSGWVICNGDNDTPDLRGRFLQGTVTLKEEGIDPNGSATHTHTGKTVGNDFGDGYGIGGAVSSNPPGVPGHAHYHNLQIDPASNIPPNVKIVFIMKE